MNKQLQTGHLHHVVIVGGGFGGLHAALALSTAPVQITLIDRRNFHLFQPLLYQVATGALSPANIAAPLRAILRRQRNARVLMGEVTAIDVTARAVRLADGETLPYDTLIVAAGVRHHYFGNDGWEAHAPGLKSIEDATEIRRRVLLAFEAAERETDPDEIRRLLTFVVIGAGPTGVELAGALAEIANFTLKGNFRHINPADATVYLLEGGDRVLPSYVPPLSDKARESLQQLGVQVKTGAMVKDITADQVTYTVGGETHILPTHTVLWAAGVRGSELGALLAEATHANLDRAGRIMIEPDLTLPAHPEIFVIGDMAHYAHQNGKPLPGVAPVAMQQAAYTAALIKRRLRGNTDAPKPFRYTDKGSMATIGRAAAVADIRGIHLWGFAGWVLWLFIHLMTLVRFQNRVLVLIQWAWSYFTRNRAARLITGATQPYLTPKATKETSQA